MIPATAQVHAVETSGVADVSRFSVHLDRNLFDLLSRKLYTDNIAAVVRELSCNADDATDGTGAWELHLPTVLEPWFAVKDHGPGLAHDDILRLYTTYGVSTKRDRNTQTGFLGVGSKSPFAVTRMFTVESRVAGTRSTYTCFLDEQGFPSITRLATTPTDEPNGLTVIVPVEAQDFAAYRDRAEAIVHRFRHRPKVLGAPDFRFDPVTYLFRAETWALRREAYDAGPRALAVMGPVAYRIDPRAIGALTSEQRALLECPIDLHFPMGSLEFQASREALNYTPETQARLKAGLDALLAEFPALVARQFEGCTTLWQAKMLFYTRIDAPNVPWSLLNLLKRQPPTWQDRHLLDSYLHVHHPRAALAWFSPLTRTSRRHRPQDVLPERIPFAFDAGATVRVTPRTRIIWDDGTVRNYQAVLRHNLPAGGIDLLLVRTPDRAVFDDILRQLGHPPFHGVLAKMTPPPKEPVERAAPTTRRSLYRLNRLGAGADWESVSYDVTGGGVYLHLHNGEVDGTPDWRDLAKSRFAPRLLLGVPASQKPVTRKPGWVHLTDHVRTELTAFAAAVDLAQVVADADEEDRVPPDLRPWLEALPPPDDSQGPFARLRAAWGERPDLAAYPDLPAIRGLCRRYEIDLPARPPRVPMAALTGAVRSRYPLLWALTRQAGPETHVEAALAYVNLVDRSAAP